MKTFRALYNRKLEAPEFRVLYEKECHVCANTVRIFEKAHEEGISHERLAAEMAVDHKQIRELADADCCDPQLVIRLCRFLDLPTPQNCPHLIP